MERISRRIIFLVAFVATMVSSSTWAQTSSLFLGTQRMPQGNTLNPAFFPKDNRMFLSLPGVSLNLTTPLNINTLKMFVPDSSAEFDAEPLVDTPARTGRVALDCDVPLLGYGIRINRLFVTAQASIKTRGELGIPEALKDVVLNRDLAAAFNGVRFVDGELMNVNAYGELGVAAGYYILPDKLSVGVRAKLMTGLFSASTVGSRMQLYTNEEQTTLYGDIDYLVRTAGCFPYDSVTGKYTNQFSMKNLGFGLDLGVSYTGRLFDVSASVQDLFSSINWSDNVQIRKPNHSDNMHIDNVDMNALLEEFDLVGTTLPTSPDRNESALTADDGAYRTYLPTRVNACAMAKPLEWLRVGLLYRGEFEHNNKLELNDDQVFDRTIRGKTSLLAQANVKDWLEVIASISCVDDGYHRSWVNPGIGLSFSACKVAQIYILADHSSSIRFANAKSFNINMGINIMLINH